MAAAHDSPAVQASKGKQVVVVVDAAPSASSEQPTGEVSLQNGTQKHVMSENVDRNAGGQESSKELQNGRASIAVDSGADPGQARPAPLENQSHLKPADSSPIASTSSVKTEEVDKQKEADKGDGSLETTLTGTGTHTYVRTQSSRRKDAKSASEGAHTSSSTAAQSDNPRSSRRAKGSFLSKVFRVLVPCVGPSQRSRLPEHENVVLRTSRPGGSSTALKEKQAAKEVEELPPPPPSTNEPKETLQPPGETTRPSVSEDPISLQALEIPTQQTDQTVIVPPTPTKILLPQEETKDVTSGAVQPPGSTGGDPIYEQALANVQQQQQDQQQRQGRDSGDDSDESTSFTDEEDLDDGHPMDEVEDEEERLIMNGGAGIPIGPDGLPRPLLPPLSPKHAGRKCLVLDLDETLVHSSFKSIQQADYVVPVEIEYHWHNVYVIKRPGVDNFLKRMGEIYEVVVFTASLSKYADPVLDKLDVHHVVSHRLFRESCYNHRGNYVKDLSQLGRPISDTIIIDNSPASYIFHPNNAVPVSSWFNDPHDTELTDLCPFLTDLGQVDDVRGVLDGGL